MSTVTSAKLYVRMALLRRKVLLRQAIGRALAGALAVAALIVAAGLATYALYLAIVPSLGQLGAVLVLAGVYLVTAIILLAYTLHEPHSPELEALAELEAAALETATAETRDVLHAFSGHGIPGLGNTVSVGLAILGVLRKLMGGKKED